MCSMLSVCLCVFHRTQRIQQAVFNVKKLSFRNLQSHEIHQLLTLFQNLSLLFFTFLATPPRPIRLIPLLVLKSKISPSRFPQYPDDSRNLLNSVFPFPSSCYLSSSSSSSRVLVSCLFLKARAARDKKRETEKKISYTLMERKGKDEEEKASSR